MNNDLISRSALKEEIIKKRGLSWESMKHLFCITGEELDNAPTVAVDNYAMGYQDGVRKVLSERPQGEWKQLDNQIYCNLCNRTSLSNSNFCPNCGADMRGAE